MPFSFLATRPRIAADPAGLTISASSIIVVATLGLFYRRARIDREAECVTIFERMAWFKKRTRTIAFKQLRGVTYGYQDENPSFGAHDAVDRFIVGLRPILGEEIPICSFIGDGSFTNNGVLPNWWYWEEYVFDVTGTQEQESRALAQLLSKMIKVPIEPSLLTDN